MTSKPNREIDERKLKKNNKPFDTETVSESLANYGDVSPAEGEYTSSYGREREQEHEHGHSHSPNFSKKTSNRLAKAMGHLDKVKRMVEEERDCLEVMTQLLAVRAAIDSTGRYILKEHITHCVADAAREGNLEVIEELKDLIDSYLK